MATVPGQLRLVVGAGVLVFLLAAGTACDSRPARKPATPGQSASSSEAALSDEQRVARLRDAVTKALQRVAPGTTLGPGADGTGWDQQTGTQYIVQGMVERNGRHGVFFLKIAQGPLDMTCTGYTASACHLTHGPRGETVRMTNFDRQVPPGQPRDTEIQARILRAGGSWVFASVDNADALYDPLNPSQVRSHTGQDPPLTEEQVHAFIIDPSLEI
jgi:hypothetical protein